MIAKNKEIEKILKISEKQRRVDREEYVGIPKAKNRFGEEHRYSIHLFQQPDVFSMVVGAICDSLDVTRPCLRSEAS